MEISLTTPSILFPAVSLLLLAYTNRFLAVASIIRALHTRYKSESSEIVLRQIQNLRRRLKLIKQMQCMGVLSLIVCIGSVVFLFFDFRTSGEILFGCGLILMLLSLVLCLMEVQISGLALEIELEDMEGEKSGT